LRARHWSDVVGGRQEEEVALDVAHRVVRERDAGVGLELDAVITFPALAAVRSVVGAVDSQVLDREVRVIPQLDKRRGIVGLVVCISVEPLPAMVSPVVPCSNRVSLMMKHPFSGNVTVELAGTVARNSDSAFVLSPVPQCDGMFAGNGTL
jgi:hypothetical protein